MHRRTIAWIVSLVIASGGSGALSYNAGHRAGAEEGRQAGEEFGRAWFEGFDKALAERAAKMEAERVRDNAVRAEQKARADEEYIRAIREFDYLSQPSFIALRDHLPESERAAFEEQYRQQTDAARERLLAEARADSPRP